MNFQKEAYEEGGSQSILYEALNTKLEEENAVTNLMEQIVHNMDYVSTYAILIGHCTYTVFQKSKSDEIDPYQSHDYRFLVAAICPVEVRVDGLIYNEGRQCHRKEKCLRPHCCRDPHRRIFIPYIYRQRTRCQPRPVLCTQAKRCQHQHYRKCPGLSV